MSTIKLTYFNMKGRAEMSRLVMAAAGRSFEDCRYKEGEWAASGKAKTPFGQCPVLTVDGKDYSQSMAIATYLARECGLYGKTNLECLAIDQYVQLCQDLLGCAVKAFLCKDESEKAELWTQFKETHAPKYMAWFERAINDNNTGFLVGSSLTLADIALYDIACGGLADMGKMCSLDTFPKVKATCDRVAANPGISAWNTAQAK